MGENPIPNNPAGRILLLFHEALNIEPNASYANGWRALLKLQDVSFSVLLHRIAPILALPNEAHEAVKRLSGKDVDHGLLLRWMPAVDQAFSSMNFNGTWDQLRGHAAIEVTRIYLEFCSDALSRHAREPIADQDELAEILSEVESLKAIVLEAEMDAGLQRFLIRHLSSIEFAIKDYRFRGHDSLRMVLAEAAGDAVLNPVVQTKNARNVAAREFWRIFTRLSQVVGFTLNVLQLADNLTPLPLLPIVEPPIEEERPSEEEIELDDQSAEPRRA